MESSFSIQKFQSGKKLNLNTSESKPKKYNPKLGLGDLKFLTWYRTSTLEGKSGIPHTDPTITYDYYSYFKNTPKTKLSTPDQHFPDVYKYPNHETFSNESIYATEDNPGGVWFGETFFKPEVLKKLSQPITSDNTMYNRQLGGLTSQAETAVQLLRKKSFDYDSVYQQARAYISRLLFNIPMTLQGKPFDGVPLKAEDIVEPAFEYYMQTGRKPDLTLLLAQAQRESFMGNKLKSKYNLFNIGNTTEGATRDFNSFRDNVMEYLRLIDEEYLLKGKKSTEDLLNNFVNYRGNRYAQDLEYENYLKKQIPYITNILNNHDNSRTK